MALVKTAKLILVVDDDAHTRNFLQICLEKEGLNVLTAASGEEALNKASKIHPTLIALDLMMPDIDGFEVARTLKQKKEFKNTYLLAITALTQEPDHRRALDAGINECLTKPFPPEKLIERIKAILATQ